MSAWVYAMLGWGVMALIMLGLWFRQRRTRNAGVVDVAWAAGIGGLAIAFAVLGDGYFPRRIIVGTIGAIWSLRLAGHLFVRVAGEEEDGRYRRLRAEWGGAAERNFFWFFQVQAFWAVLFATPMLIAARNSVPQLTWYDAAGLLVWAIALIGESIADRQLAQFRQDPNRRGQVCRVGLWSWSRHPNYFFEWLHWWAYVFVGLAAPWGGVTLMGPILMLWFLLRVTGIPYTEEQALASRGDAYRDYQKTVSAFLPWPPRQVKK